jgi:hypothetical protein
MAAAAIVAATVIAACGSNSPSSSSSGGQLTEAQMQQDIVRFAQCMRSHGVPNLPDPTTSPHEFKTAFADPSPAFQSAYAVCRHLQPGGGPPGQSAAHNEAHIVALLAFARCLRSHGFPNFPDPNSSGEVTHQMLANVGINVHQPAVLQTADACVGVTHGALTKTLVARFVAGR